MWTRWRPLGFAFEILNSRHCWIMLTYIGSAHEDIEISCAGISSLCFFFFPFPKNKTKQKNKNLWISLLSLGLFSINLHTRLCSKIWGALFYPPKIEMYQATYATDIVHIFCCLWTFFYRTGVYHSIDCLAGKKERYQSRHLVISLDVIYKKCTSQGLEGGSQA